MSIRAVVLSITILTFSVSLIPSRMMAASTQFGGLTFTLTNNESDGSAFVSTDGSTLTITGPNDGSGLPGTTDLTATIPAAGTVAFQYSFCTGDDPGLESIGYLLNGVLTELADTDGESGSVAIAVNAGDVFGFEADSVDNTGGAGITTVTDFSAPHASVATAPEPATWTLMGATAAIGTLFVRRRQLKQQGVKK